MRLIDADELLQDMQAWQEIYLMGPAHFKMLVDKKPTVYDLGGVVKQLEEKKRLAYEKCDGGASYKAYCKAIEIVKGGAE